MTSTLGKAMGGASGGFTTGRKEIIEMLRQRSRPYLFSNSVAPPIVAGSLAVLDLLEKSTELRDRLESNTKYFREGMTSSGFDLSLIHISEPTRQAEISYAVFCLKKKKK